MAASFIQKSNGQFYLRLTGNTTTVKFAAVANAGNTYSFYIYGSDSGTIAISKPFPNNETYYSASANPVPNGGYYTESFSGAETAYTFSGSGTRDYLIVGYGVDYNGNGTEYTYNNDNALMCLGGATLSWGSYAYPGDGYISLPISAGVKNGGVWNSAYNIFVKNGGVWKECQTAWIKQGGTWKKFYQNFGNSSWINMLELLDDPIDFAIQVIEIWGWPVSSFDTISDVGPRGTFTSNATSDTATPPNSQSTTLYIEIYPVSGSSANLSLIRSSDGATIWTRLNITSTYTETITFNVDTGSSYYFSSSVSIPSGGAGTSYTYVRRNNSSGTLVYSNSANIYFD
jgi:hypothetical protein